MRKHVNIATYEGSVNMLDNVVYPWAPNNDMCLNGEKIEHHRIGNNLTIEKKIYKDPTGNKLGLRPRYESRGIMAGPSGQP